VLPRGVAFLETHFRGRLSLQVDESITVYDKPVNRFVASSIGSPPMNFMIGRSVKNNGRLY